MKFLVITAISEYETDVKHILKKCEIETFSFHEITGYKNESPEDSSPNWFAADERHATASMMFHVFATVEKAQCLFKEVNRANAAQEFQSKIHIVSLNVEQSNTTENAQ
jgi:hypothetical protein